MRQFILVIIILALVGQASAVREKSGAGDVTPELNTSWFNTLLETMQGSSPDFFGFVNALMLPFSTSLGGVFYLFI
ncbi:MAG: hypothetical protein Q8M94_19375, partial [Ignavibacteria bacterium]|nr:hypothetical protein [Ignavibacteria bacterium]